MARCSTSAQKNLKYSESTKSMKGYADLHVKSPEIRTNK
jgi:hypothetical protein